MTCASESDEMRRSLGAFSTFLAPCTAVWTGLELDAPEVLVAVPLTVPARSRKGFAPAGTAPASSPVGGAGRDDECIGSRTLASDLAPVRRGRSPGAVGGMRGDDVGGGGAARPGAIGERLGGAGRRGWGGRAVVGGGGAGRADGYGDWAGAGGGRVRGERVEGGGAAEVDVEVGELASSGPAAARTVPTLAG